MSAFAKATARQSSLFPTTRAKTGGKGIRTPDFQLAKLALYQLSYAPQGLPNFDCNEEKTSAGCRSYESGIRPVCVSSNRQICVRVSRMRRVSFPCQFPPTGTAKYGVLTPASIALPVISPLSLMSFAVSRRAEKPPLRSLRSVGVLP